MQLVCDPSVVVALLLDSGPDGRWAASTLAGGDLAAPDLLPFEVANIVRRHELAGAITADQATLAHADFLDLPIELWPYSILADGVWRHRRNLTSYDASYVALAEQLGAGLVTLDQRIGRAPGVECPVLHR